MTKRTTLEVIAPTIEEAIDKGLSELGLSEDNVEVEVLDEGKRNLFRFASRQARIRMTVKTDVEKHLEKAVEISKTDSKDKSNQEPQEVEIDLLQEDDETIVPGEKDVDSVAAVETTLQRILDKIGVKAEIQVTEMTSESLERPIVQAKIEGEDLSFLIGRKSETLNALQYLLSLMVSHQLSRWVPIQVDIQNYRLRRQSELQKIARRTAQQVISTGRKQCLEPMPANERRIIHMELRDNKDVETESFGDEPNRKVCIHPR